jgi:hypothetical protein
MQLLAPADGVVITVAHEAIKSQGWALVRRLLKPEGGVVVDVKGYLDRAQKPDNVTLWRM